MPEQSPSQIQVTKRAAPFVSPTEALEVVPEAGRAPDNPFERRLPDEQQGPDQRLGELLGRGAAGFLSTVGLAYLPSRPRHDVLHVNLMFGDHEGDDVAVSRQIGRRVEQVGQIGYVATSYGLRPRRLRGPGRHVKHHVAHVPLAAVRPRHVPAAPPLGQRGLVGGQLPGVVRGRLTQLVGGSGPDEKARHSTARQAVRVVALQAETVLPPEFGGGAGGLAQGVEDGPQNGVHRRDLHEVAASQPRDVDLVRKVEGTGPLR